MRNEEKLAIQCHTEYDALKYVIVVPPKYMAITEVINETQAHYVSDNINIDIAIQQHQSLVDKLQAEGAVVHELDAKPELNEQVFTRDIAFVIGEKLFISNMQRDIRKKEVAVLMNWLVENEVPYEVCELPSIEGGDVIVDGKQVWVGVSGRTSRAAIHALQAELPNYNISPIRLREDILHLDCVFNVINEDTALIFRDAIHQRDFEKIKGHYNLIEVTAEEQFAMGPNVLAIGEKKIISLPENKQLNRQLTETGFDVIEIPFSEIIKSGGSYRCCTLPLLRK